MAIVVRLTADEIWHVLIQGGLRRIRTITNGRRDKFGCVDSLAAWGYDIEGAAGEYATAKALHLFWSGAGSVGAMDVDGLQVRTGFKNQALVIRPNNADADRFVFVTGSIPQFTIHGWLYGYEGKQPKYLRDPGGYKKPAYFIPIADLHPIEELMRQAESLETF